MNKFVKDYDAFLAEGFSSSLASLFNTSGMGNVSASSFSDVSEDEDETADIDGGKHTIAHNRMHDKTNWMSPSGTYANRNWLVPNYEMFKEERQSMTRFQIGQSVKCVAPNHESCGLTGKIIAFEDATIRWEVSNSQTGIGQTSKQYRCLPSDLDLI